MLSVCLILVTQMANAAQAIVPAPMIAAVRPQFAYQFHRQYKPIDINIHEFEAFLDEFVASRMERQHVPGVVFYMVKDGKPFLAKGYGFANLEQRTPMDPEHTVLAVGSLTKLFTATACMQLVEQEKLDLFADVNTYLEAFKIEPTFDQPVTLATLLEHTDGFDVAHIGIATRHAEDVMPLETYLAQHLPARVRPPGSSAVYGEHGMSLAGYLIQVVTGIPYADYMRANVLEPLDMSRSDYRIRDEMKEHLCVAYTFEHGSYQPVGPEYAYHVQPSAGLYATARDLGQFMLAHLEREDSRKSHIISDATADLMFQQKFGLHPMLSAWSYGFHSRFHAGEFCIEHGGMSLRTVSQMLIMPERRIGFVISGNQLSMQLHKEFLSAFLTRYFGKRSNTPPFDPDAPGMIDPMCFEGWYASLHRSISTLERLSDTSRQTRVVVTSPTTIRTHSTFNHVTWNRIAPAVYESEDGEARIAFVFDNEKNVVALLNGPHECLRLHWWQTIPVHRALFGAIAITFLSGMVSPLFLMRLRRNPGAALKCDRRHRLHIAIAWTVCTLNVVFLAGLIQILRTANHLEFVFGLPPAMKILLWFPIVTTALTPALLGFAITSWIDQEGSRVMRWHQSVIAVAALGFVPLASYWNLIGFNL